MECVATLEHACQVAHVLLGQANPTLAIATLLDATVKIEYNNNNEHMMAMPMMIMMKTMAVSESM